MQRVEDLKKECNELFSHAINEIEVNGDVKVVRNCLLSASEKLVKISSVDISMKVECETKAKKLLNVSKAITNKDDFKQAYFVLTGSILDAPQKKQAVESNREQSALKSIDNPNVTKNFDTSANEKFTSQDYLFNWDERPMVCFDDVAGLEGVKEAVFNKVIMPLKTPELFDGYEKKNGGGILLYGPPGTGKTMIAAAIAHEINAKFCSIGPSELLRSGIGNSEKLVATLFKEARSFPCCVVFFDELESLCPISTHAQHARQIRSELLKQMQGMDSYNESNNKILLLVGATNKPWDVDPAFVRPGRFGTRVYVDLPNEDARRYMIDKCLKRISSKNKVRIAENINIDSVVQATKGFNGSDITNLLDAMQENSIKRARQTNDKIILQQDFDIALEKVRSSVQIKDVERLEEWVKTNG